MVFTKGDAVWKLGVEARKRIKEDPVLWEDYNNKRYANRYSINKSVKLTEKQEQLIYGTLLGDGSINIQKGGRSPYLIIGQGIDQEGYVRYKRKELATLYGSDPKVSSSFGFGKLNFKVYFYTLSLPCLLPIYNTVITNGVKTVTPEWIDMISNKPYTDLALAMWYMDDGTLGNHMLPSGDKTSVSIRFSLGNRTDNECNLLKGWMETEFGIPSKIYTYNQSNKLLTITKRENLLQFIEIVNPWVSQIPAMWYKTRLLFKGKPTDINKL